MHSELTPFDDTGAEDLNPGAANNVYLPPLKSVLRRRWTIILTFALITMAALPAIWLLQKPVYRAHAIVRVSPVIPRIVYKMDENRTLPFFQAFLNTQVSLIRSPRVLERVLDKPEVQQTNWYQDDRALKRVGSHLARLSEVVSASQRQKTELIDVYAELGNPNEAAILANALVDAYTKLAREGLQEGEVKRLEALHQRRKALRLKLRSIDEAVAALGDEFGTTALDELRKQLSEHVSSLRQQLSSIRIDETLVTAELGDVEDANAEAAADQGLIGSDELYAQDIEWRQLERDYRDLQNRHGIARQNFGEKHPTMLALSADMNHALELVVARQDQLDRLTAVPGRENLPIDRAMRADALKLRIRQLQRQSAALAASIDDHQGQLDRAAKTAREVASLTDDREQKSEQYDAVSARLYELETEQAAPGRLSIVAQAIPLKEPYRDRRALLSTMAIGFAMMAAVALAYLRNFLDPSVQGTIELQTMIPSTFLGTVPEVPESEICADFGRGPMAEPIRMIRTALQQRIGNRSQFALLITSPGPAAGKSTLAIHLSASFGRTGRKVLLIDADLRRPGLDRKLKIPNGRPGLRDLFDSDRVSASHKPHEVVVATNLRNVDLVPAGSNCQEAEEYECLDSERFKELIELWKAQYGLVIVDGPPILPVADARILARQLDGALLSIRADYTARGDLVDAWKEIDNAGGQVIGSVLMGAKTGPGYAAYGFGYSYEPPPSTDIVPVT